MIPTLKLFRRAVGTNSEFHLDGKLVKCEIVFRAGLGNCYVYETTDAAEARRLQLIHGFKIEARSTVNVDRMQVAALGSQAAQSVSSSNDEESSEDTAAPAKKKRAGRSRKKKAE